MTFGVDAGTASLYREIYQETSSGDLGLQVAEGPVFRVHTHVLGRCGGFLGKVRLLGKKLPRQVDEDNVRTPLEYFREKGYATLLQDLVSIQLSQPIEKSAMRAGLGGFLNQRQDPMKPSFTTSRLIDGHIGAIRRMNPYFLAERYEVDCDCERLAEMLRFSYQGVMSFFDVVPRTDQDKKDLTKKMLNIMIDSERYSVDALYERLLHWFSSDCFHLVGQLNYCNAFYHLLHFEQQCTEEHSREALVKTVTIDMLKKRGPFSVVTRDPRWCSLPVEFVERILHSDFLPIALETEVLNLIERWNANADKRKQDIARLLICFRPDQDTRSALLAWLRNMGWLDANDNLSSAPPGPEFNAIRRILKGSTDSKPPRYNLQGNDLSQAQKEAEVQASGGADNGKEDDAVFLHYKGNVAIGEGHSFRLGQRQRLVQVSPIREAGIQRMRVAFSNPRTNLWDPDHEIFVGLSYGEGRYFGYLVSATSFSGIFSLRALASAAPAPNEPVHMTGSGNKVEFDLELQVELQRANLVVANKLSVIFCNEVLTQEYFQISYDTLIEGPGLRYQVVATGLEDSEVDVQLASVSGGQVPEEDLTNLDLLHFKDGD
jgi:hypothetical protein